MDERVNTRDITDKLLTFLENSPTSFHAVENMAARLRGEGFEELKEADCWSIEAGGRYFVTRNMSSLIAFRVPGKDFTGFQIISSHSDSPTFKIKENPEMKVEGHYVKLNVEKYGGMLCAPWFDRPLSIAGRLVVRTADGLQTKLVNVDRDLVMIPNLAIHMNRQVNDGYAYNAQSDMLPLYGGEAAAGTLMKTIAQSAGVAEEDILGHDLYLYNRMKGSVWGAGEEFFSCGRIDDLQCAFGSLEGFLAGGNAHSVSVHAVLDNEEVGSTTKQGAASTFLLDTLKRLNTALGRTEEQYLTALASSFMVSADNAHGVHPNYTDKADPTNRPYLNGGIVIKFNANQKYTTDAVSAAVFRSVCEKADVPVQTFTNRSDMAGGSTLGNISNTHVALNTVDIGLPELAMHSPYETGGVLDTEYLIRAAKEFFSTGLKADGDGSYRFVS
ncbi:MULTISPECIES: M18 family aminopeptidase [Enterocloster]|uniref:M18 family aminopeptidase n=1 Tax=Enterocloster lavalensis TaxID=460384 RepID=A0A1I0AS44_9FIRM|nr:MULTISPECIES: M18 family aminopeptidase [Enterocloster]MDR3756787.1 M18 family aminopeptidase [Enterocloster sp.]SES97181.1 aspartyl aminopeptidase [Enterocloster lavalensis]